MIDCPICHVMNEDMARFCAECGQRLTPPLPAAAQPSAIPLTDFAQSTATGGPLSAGQAPESANAADQKTDFNRLRNMGDKVTPNSTRSESPKGLRSPLLGGSESSYEEPQAHPAKSGGLRSPLLGGSDSSYEEPQARPAKSGGLRSPLLGGSDSSYEEPQARPAKSGGLHSPLLGGSDSGYEEPQARPAKSSGLHSPLLGGSDSSYEEPQTRPAKSGGLHSPLLGGSDSAYEEPQAHPAKGSGSLRSPLLGSSQSGLDNFSSTGQGALHSPLLGNSQADYAQGGGFTEHSPRRAGSLHSPLLGGSESHSFAQEPEYYSDEEIDDPNILRSPLLAAKLPVADKSAAPKPSAPQPPPAPTQVPPSTPAAGLPNNPDTWQSPQAGQIKGSARSEHLSTSNAAGSEPPAASLSLRQAFSSQQAPPAAPAASSRSLRSEAAQQPFIASQSSEMQASSSLESKPRKRATPKMLVSDEPEIDDQTYPTTGTFKSTQSALPGFVKLLVLPLAAAAACKLWYLSQFLNQLTPPFLGDQIGQLVVVLTLIMICWSAGKSD